MKVKRFVLWTVVVLVIFAVLKDPTHSAGQVGGILTGLRHGAEAVITFVQNVFQQ